MNKRLLQTGGAAMGLLAIAAGSSPVLALAEGTSTDTGLAFTQNEAGQAQLEPVNVSDVQGEFSYDQSQTTPNEVIAQVFNRAAQAMCASRPANSVSVDDWNLTVDGDVNSGFTATLGDLAGANSQQTTMTCTCTNNIAGGNAIINADVEGVPVASLAKKANMRPDANAIVFKAADGKDATLSLAYVLKHNGMIVYKVNGDDLSQSVGGTNQLWLSSSAGKYFTRDVVDVEFVHMDQAPDDPSFQSTGFEYVNRPNVGVDEEG